MVQLVLEVACTSTACVILAEDCVACISVAFLQAACACVVVLARPAIASAGMVKLVLDTYRV
jgi:hypothetical protein